MATDIKPEEISDILKKQFADFEVSSENYDCLLYTSDAADE